MPCQLLSVPYPFCALLPYIGRLTMQIHHGKRHEAYVNNMNAAQASFREWLGTAGTAWCSCWIETASLLVRTSCQLLGVDS